VYRVAALVILCCAASINGLRDRTETWFRLTP
jgi:hypothetical protein